MSDVHVLADEVSSHTSYEQRGCTEEYENQGPLLYLLAFHASNFRSGINLAVNPNDT
jgi:hypothetical protein